MINFHPTAIIEENEFPKFLLDKICWDFTSQDKFPSQERFEDAVTNYNIEAFEDDEQYNFDEEFDFKKIVLENSSILVSYYADPTDGKGGFHFIEIKSANGVNFSNGELFYKLHNLVVHKLRNSGHCYFEGLEFSQTNSNGIPIYEMIGGS
jgi:hypothetical protein